MSLKLYPAEMRRFEKKKINNIIIKMKSSVGKFYSSLDTSKENKLEDQKKLAIWNVAQRDNIVENTDKRSIYYMIPFIESSRIGKTEFSYSGLYMVSFLSDHPVIFLDLSGST